MCTFGRIFISKGNQVEFDEILALFQEKSVGRAGFGGKVRLDVEGAGSILIDGSGDSVVVVQNDGDADSTIALSLETLQGLLGSDLTPALALMSGKLSVGGNLGLAMKLQGLLDENY